MLRLDDGEVWAANYGLSEFLRHRHLAGKPKPPAVLLLRDRLNSHVRLSSTRHENGCAATDRQGSEVWIGATAAAAMLGRGPRYVQRHAEQIGGQLIGGRYVFLESDVIDFMKRTTHADTRD